MLRIQSHLLPPGWLVVLTCVRLPLGFVCLLTSGGLRLSDHAEEL